MNDRSVPQPAATMPARRRVSSSLGLLVVLAVCTVASSIPARADATFAGPGDRRAGRQGAERQTVDRQKPSRQTASRQTASRQTAERGATDRERSRGQDASRERSTEDLAAKLGSRDASPEVQQLKDDLSVLAGGAKASSDEIAQLAADLQGMAVQPPDPALTQALAASLSAAVDDGDLSPQEIAQLARAVEDVMASAGIDADEAAVLIADVEAILAASGVGRAEVQAVVRDLQAISASVSGTSAPSSRRGGAGRRSRG